MIKERNKDKKPFYKIKSKKIIDNSYFCRDKNCRSILRPDWISSRDRRYCKDCLD